MSALPGSTRRLPWRRGRAARWGWASRIALGVLVLVLLVAVFGPFFAPYSPTELAGIPFQHVMSDDGFLGSTPGSAPICLTSPNNVAPLPIAMTFLTAALNLSFGGKFFHADVGDLIAGARDWCVW